MATNFVGKIDLVVHMTFARVAPPAYDKKGNYYAERRQTNYLIRWTQANQLPDQLTIINIGGEVDKRWVTDKLCLAPSLYCFFLLEASLRSKVQISLYYVLISLHFVHICSVPTKKTIPLIFDHNLC